MQIPVTKSQQEEDDNPHPHIRSQDCPILLNFYDRQGQVSLVPMEQSFEENRDSRWLQCELSQQQR